MVQITNVVVQTDLQVTIDLRYLVNNTRDIRYDPKIFSGAIWHNRRIGGSCLVFHNGKLNCNGNRSIHQAKKRTRQYARALQKLGFCVRLQKIDLITMSAVHTLSSTLDFSKMCTLLEATYDPEIYNAAMLKKGKVHFNCFHTGKVVITGIKNINVIYPTLLELELCTSD